MEMLKDARPEVILESAQAWKRVSGGGASAAEEYRRTCLAQLESWHGLAGLLARAKARGVVERLEEMPGKCRVISQALLDLYDEVKAAHDRLHDALDEARKHDIQVNADGHVFAGRADHKDEDKGDASGRLDRIRTGIADSVAAATKADQTCRDRIEAALSDAEWYEERAFSPERVADLLEKAASGDQQALAELKKHEELLSDPYFSKELLQAIGPKRLLELPGVMSVNRGDVFPEGTLDSGSGALVRMLSDVLAAGTDPRNPAWDDGELDSYLDDLKYEGNSTGHKLSEHSGTYPGYWGLGQILGASDGEPPYSAKFMNNVGNDMIAWDRRQSEAHDGWPATAGPYATEPGIQLERPGNVTTDPLAGLMHAAGSNAEGAQAILTQDNLNYLLDERDNWPDKGDALGEAIEAGASGHDETSKRIAAQSVDLLAEHTREYLERDGNREAMTITGNPDGLSGLRDSMANVLNSHIDDVNAAIVSGREISDGEYVPLGYDERSAPLDPRDLAYVMTDVAMDEKAYEDLIAAQISYMTAEMDRVAGGDGERETRAAALATAAGDTGHVMGFITEAHAAAEQATGRSADQPTHQLADMVRKGVGLIDPPTGDAGKLAGVGKPDAAEWIARQIETRHELAAFGRIEDDRTAKNILTEQVIERAIVEHELYREKPGPEHSFMDGEEFKAMNQIITDEHLHWDFNAWAREEANEIRGVKQSVGVVQGEGWDTYRTQMGLSTH